MIKIRLYCAGGASTSLVAEKMRNEAAKRGLDVSITATGVSVLEHMTPAELEDVDVALLGPQVSFTMPTVEGVCANAGVPLAVIPMRDYGMCDGPAVLDLALKLYEGRG